MEVKRRARVVGVFAGKKIAVSLSTIVMLRVKEDWALRRYFDALVRATHFVAVCPARSTPDGCQA